MATIDYIDKIDNHEPPEGIVTAADMNEIKDVVNANEPQPNPSNTVLAVGSIAELLTVTDVELGMVRDVLGYHDGSNLGGGLFTVIQTEFQRYLSFVNGANQSLDVPNNDIAIGLETADTIEVTFRYNENPNSWAMCDFKKASTNVRVAFNTIDTLKDYSYNTNETYSKFNWIKDTFGNSIQYNALEYGVWYTLSVSPIDGGNLFGINIGDAYGQYPSFDISSFKIKDVNFPIQENSGATTTGSDGTICTLENSPTWNTATYDNGFSLIESGEILWKRQINQNTVSPFDFGAVDNKEPYPTNPTDSYEALQAWADSGFNLIGPPCFLSTTQTILFRKPVNVNLSGRFKPMDDGTTDLSQVDSLTVISANTDIDVFRIQSHSVNIYNGLIDVSNVDNYTKAAIVWDINFRIWSGEVSTNCYGNKANLINTGIGGYAYLFETSNIYQYGYFEDIKVTGDGYYFNKQVYVPEIPDSPYNSFHNGFTFECRGDGCKSYYDVTTTKVWINGMQQDRAILNEDEKDTPAIYLRVNDGFVNCFVFDTKLEDNPPFRHFTNIYDITGTNLTIFGEMQRQYYNGVINNGVINVSKLMLNGTTKLENPNAYLLSSHQGTVSDINNCIKYVADAGAVSFKGYLAPDTSYFENTLVPSILTEDANVVISNPENLLASGINGGSLISYLIQDNVNADLNFAEIVISDLDTIQGFTGSDKIERLYLVARPLFKQIQVIVEFDTGTESEISNESNGTILGGNQSFQIFNNRGNRTDSFIRSIIIRLIGTYSPDTNIGIGDIALKAQKRINLPYIESHGNQNFYGDLTYPTSTTGMILTDRTTSTQYRLFVDNGVLNVEAI